MTALKQMQEYIDDRKVELQQKYEQERREIMRVLTEDAVSK